jgi:hypothetical protein
MEFVALIAKIALFLGVVWLAGSVITLFLARKRGGNILHWLLLSLLLGPVGILLTLKLAQPCPHCQTKVLREVHICPQCERQIPRIGSDDNPTGPLWSYRRNW